MMNPHKKLLCEIDAFIAASGMGESYFGKAAVNNSELVSRLRNGGRVWPETAQRVRDFIAARKNVAKSETIQATVENKSSEAAQ